MSKDKVIVRAKGVLNHTQLEELRELIEKQMDEPFIIVDDRVDYVDVVRWESEVIEPISLDGRVFASAEELKPPDVSQTKTLSDEIKGL